MRDAVNSVLNRLPPGIDPPVIRKQDTDSSPILTLAVSGQRDRRELYVLADRYVKNVIESAPGVGQVSITGAAERAVQVNIEARRLAAYGLSIIQVRDALVRQNADIPGGRVDAGFRELRPADAGPLPPARATSSTWSWPRSTARRSGSATWARPSTPPRRSARSPGSTASRPSCSRCSGSRARTRSR